MSGPLERPWITYHRRRFSKRLWPYRFARIPGSLCPRCICMSESATLRLLSIGRPPLGRWNSSSPASIVLAAAIAISGRDARRSLPRPTSTSATRWGGRTPHSLHDYIAAHRRPRPACPNSPRSVADPRLQGCDVTAFALWVVPCSNRGMACTACADGLECFLLRSFRSRRCGNNEMIG